VVDIKDKELNLDSESGYENSSKRKISDANPTATVVIASIQPEEPIYSEEGELLFHLQMWVKGTPLHFIVDRESQKNLISAEVIKQLGLLTKQHPYPCNIELIFQGQDLCVSQ
jgi:hypothetical protein